MLPKIQLAIIGMGEMCIRDRLHPLQMLIRSLISSINTSSYMGARVSSGALVPTNSIKMAVVCLTVGPIILAYPFVQKYFVEGISVGAVKG